MIKPVATDVKLCGVLASLNFKSSTRWQLCAVAGPLLSAYCSPKEQTTTHTSHNVQTPLVRHITCNEHINDNYTMPNALRQILYINSAFKPRDCASASALVRARSAPRDRALVPPEPAFVAQQPDGTSAHHSSPVQSSALPHGY